MGDATAVSDLPAGTVTFMLTDVEGSTRLWESHTKEMQRALARHDQILAEAVATYGGVLVKHKGEGDSAFAVFTRASDAAGAALSCQTALLSEAWPDGVEPRVRIAIHTGEAELRDGDYYGPVINRTARLRGTAHGGQIVLSHTTADLVRDHLPAGAALNDLGVHRLPDLGRPETIFDLTHPDLPSTFPPLRSLDAFPSNLPVQLTSFVGRERELKLIADGLSSARLVTLTGSGGVGKTRLALHTAADVVADFPDGAWLCELAAAADPTSMLQVVAVTLGLPTGPSAFQADDIAEFVGARRLLLVLDNCEHLLDSVADLAEVVVARCPLVRVLATSREALGVSGEQVIRLRPLAVPTAGTGLEELARVDATRLFVERAAALGSQRFETADAPAIVEICRRLDGIPLAIELAAARAVALSPSEISNLLDERFRLLTGGRRASMERHHTLRAAIDWSYSLLADTERQLFDRLGVFPATFDAPAAQALAADIETWDVLDALSSLVAKSMVVADRMSSGATRYQMLETMRQYARERLDACGMADAGRRRHARYYAELVRQARNDARTDDDVTRWSRLRIEVDNLRAAVLWALDSGAEDSELALSITANMSRDTFEEWSGVFSWGERAVERAEVAEPGVRSVVLAVASMSAWYQTDYVRAHTLARDALRDGSPDGSPAPELPYMALILSSRPQQMRGILADGLAALDAIGADSLSHARLHSAAAGYAAQIGDLEFAAAEARETLRIGRQGRLRFFIMTGLYLVALTSWGTAPDNALAALEESIALSRRESLSANFRGRALALAAQLRAEKGDAAGGLSALQESIIETHRIGERTAVATAFDRGIQVLASTGHDELAALLGGVVTEGVFANTYGVPAHEMPNRQRALERLGAELGADAYAATIARGAAMSYDEAVDFANRKLGALLTP